MSVPRIAPFLPLYCGDGHASVQAASTTAAFAQPHTSPFTALAEANLCLQCASPLETQCGFTNCSMSHDHHGALHCTMFQCECPSCERACAETAGDPTCNYRARLLDRHRFNRIDDALSVDAPLAETAYMRANAIPVLCIRRALIFTPDDSPLRSFLDSDLFQPPDAVGYIYCSFKRTAAFVGGTDAGKNLYRRMVAARVEELRARFQIDVEEFLVDESCAEHFVYMRSLLLRVVIAYEAIEAISADIRLAENSDARLLLLSLQMFADTHLDLMVFCDTMQNYTDFYLSTPTLCTMVETEWGHALRESDLPAALAYVNSLQMSEAVLLTPLERYYPHALRAVYAGEMPDIGPTMTMANLWKKVNEKNSRSAASSFVHVFVRKLVDQRCLSRNFHGMMASELATQPALITVVLNLLEICMMGNIETARFRPQWTARLAVRNTFHWDRFELRTWCNQCHPKSRAACPHCEAEGKSRSHEKHLCDMCRLLSRCRRFLFFAAKEFFVYNIHVNGLLDDLLDSEATWKPHCAIVENACDDSRRLLSAAFDDLDSLSPDTLAEAQENIEKTLLLHHDCSKTTMRRARKWSSIYEHMLAKFDKLHNKYLTSKTWTGYQEPQDFLTAPLLDHNFDAEAPPPGVWPEFYHCAVKLPHLTGRRWCDVYTPSHISQVARYCEIVHHDFLPSLLVCVGVSPGAQSKLEYMHHISEMRDAPDNRLQSICLEIMREYPVDFHIIHYFVRCMKKSSAIQGWMLDAGQALAQATALRRRMRLPDWARLPFGAGIINACEHHLEACVDIPRIPTEVDWADVSDKRGTGSLLSSSTAASVHGVIGALYDAQLGCLVCSRTINSASRNKWEKIGANCADYIEDDAARVKSIVAARHSERECAGKPLQLRSVVGCVWKIGNTAYTLCVKCGCTCEWRDACMTTEGMTCGHEVRVSERQRYTHLTQHVSRATRPVGENPGTSALFFAPLDECLLQPVPPLDERGDLFERTASLLMDTEFESETVQRINIAVGDKKVDAGSLLKLEQFADTEEAHRRRAEQTQCRKQPGARRVRTGQQRTRFADRHNRFAPDGLYTTQEWDALDERTRVYRWTPAGKLYRANVLEVESAKNFSYDEKEELLRLLHEKEALRVKQLEREGFFEHELARASGADECRETLLRARRRLQVDRFTDHQVVEFRNLFIEQGYLEGRLEIVCANCRARCDRSSRFGRVALNNAAGTLIDGQTGDPITNTGVVNVFMCVKCITLSQDLFAVKPVPLVSDLALFIEAKRNKTIERAMKFHHNH
jgi:hypothetical protein